eukprot:CAMPEP_0197331914 /NCGR_PEP_ID=MMETSP0892-20130614/13563_1 /TAXON_ID=44058 ORGANISM="Aureoumbra lagunensis, Strain CCMP1510" /NCGR_SAMPLE_ID=MMETSP0892 /ASSEMBLY_ACC=CAM_ASM_000538 /LENGTH=342 /DNA_ID=CAMNT_0042830145 /DNA_START=29 /DNA_END=1057 /DNA_ORIENTATION=-
MTAVLLDVGVPVAVPEQPTPIACPGPNVTPRTLSRLPTAEEVGGHAISLNTICEGKHALLPGVYAFILTGLSRKTLIDPRRREPNLSAFLQRKHLTAKFEFGLQRIASWKETKKLLGTWNIKAIDKAMSNDSYQLAENVHIFACERISETKSWQFLEIIDRSVAPKYVSQYAISNLGQAKIEIPYFTIRFPRGVFIEELKQREKRTKLREYTPPDVLTLLQRQDLLQEYDAFIQDCLATEYKYGPKWDPEKLTGPIFLHRNFFRAKNVDLHLAYKVHRSNAHHSIDQLHMWIEYVDLSILPNYIPQRGVGFGVRAKNNAFTANNVLGTRVGYKRTEIECSIS